MAFIFQTKVSFQIIFYHFHAFRIHDDDKVDLGNYRLDKKALSLIYKPYIKHLLDISNRLESLGYQENIHGKLPCKRGLKAAFRSFLRTYHGSNNVFRLKDLT